MLVVTSTTTPLSDIYTPREVRSIKALVRSGSTLEQAIKTTLLLHSLDRGLRNLHKLQQN